MADIIEISANNMMTWDKAEFNGKVPDSMFSVRKPAWHGIGTIVQANLTSAEALPAAGLDWTSELGPIYTPDMTEIPGFRRVYRSDNQFTLGVVGDRYHSINNSESFAIGDSIIGDNQAKWTVAGSLDGGKVVWMLAELDQNLFVAGEQIMPYFLVTTSHDGRSSMKLLQTPVRVVCQNTLNMALGKSTRLGKVEEQPRIINIRHTRNYETRLAEAKKLLGLTRKYYASFETQATELANQLFSKAQFEDLLAELVKTPDEDASKRAVTNANNTRDLVMAAYNADDLNNIRGTKWGAYNAIADYSDHSRQLRGEDGDRAERNFTRTFQDTDFKDLALDLLLSK